ncbi:DNA repair-scaffolding protein isoform X2 [Rhineura floridana]|uniref:DNA repair-scaffolding protein isoform X2 n=1 Tax=Rhineura floridana TaxID=261503 RepID=UPI002AC8851E|nr:DNA repair-scaffolding protein isoform X2 [Rhineura floridana]
MKRKRTWCSELASFPDEKPVGEGKRNSGTVVAAASVSSAWLRCGDGFQTASSLETKESSEKTSSVKKCFASLLSSVEEISQSESLNELTDIVWSSSGSDVSDDNNKTLTSRFPCLKVEKYRKHSLISKDGCNEGEPHTIDWENDSDCEDNVEQYNASKTDGFSFNISDTDSCTDSNFMSDEEKEDKPSKMISIEISEYSSDSENMEKCQVETEAANLEFPKKLHFSFGAGIETDTGRSASDWLKSAQIFLQTPEKKGDKNLKTPEDSAKKRKFLRGGLAERLNKLQNRERAAISFWRHQCISDNQIPSGGKSGVLTVKILEMHEECTLHIAICHQLGQICTGSSSTENAADGLRLKVLFTKETAVHLKLSLQDVLYIHHPWQKVLLPNENIPVIMNTYFSQKVVKEPTEMDRPHLREPLLTKRKISLAWIFSFSTVKDNWPQASAINQVPCINIKPLKTAHIHSNNESKLSPFGVTSLSDSLLDVVETQGRAGGRGIQVQVVVQRVYYLLSKESLRCHLQKNTSKTATPLLHSDLPNVRLCLLVQDAYGIFSEVHFHVLFSSEQIEKYSKRWEGKYCHLSGIKILQRLTRGRVLGLFSLIDSLWPPLLPLKVPGQSQENDMHSPHPPHCSAKNGTACISVKKDSPYPHVYIRKDMTQKEEGWRQKRKATNIVTNLPPPSICYILAAQPDQIHVDTDDSEEQISNLYFPPVVHSLKEILQMGGIHQCCSFWAHVVYRRLQVTGTTSSSQKQFWLFVTDFSLQNGAEISPETPKALPVSVDSSCVIDVEVMETLKSTSPCDIFFKDALCGNGRIICIERTVLLLQRPLLYRAASADITELTGPVRLDELDSATQVNSICTVRATVAGVNERTAFSWPTCNRCGNGKVEQHPQDRDLLYCSQCCDAIISPVLKMHLEVFLHCQSRPLCTIKVKLLQKTISSLLESSSAEDGSYEVKSVLGKEVGVLYCYVQSVTSHPSSCVGLEEIVLQDAGRN